MMISKIVVNRIFPGTEQRLLAAILVQGIKDACEAEPYIAAEARGWLTDVGVLIAHYLGFAQTALRVWVAGLPKASCQQSSSLSNWEDGNVAQ